MSLLQRFMQLLKIYFFLAGSELGENLSTRLALTAIKMTAAILVPAYSAAIISFLTISTPKYPFVDIDTFLEDGTYKTSGFEGIYSQNFFLVRKKILIYISVFY